MTISVQLGSLSESEIAAGEIIQKLGLEVENITPELARKYNCPDVDGVLITNVKSSSPAASVGLQRGYVITHVAFNNLNAAKKIDNVAGLDAAVKESGDKKYIILVVRLQNHQRYYTIKIN